MLRIEVAHPAAGHLPPQLAHVALVELGELSHQLRVELRAGAVKQLGHRPLLRHRRADRRGPSSSRRTPRRRRSCGRPGGCLRPGATRPCGRRCTRRKRARRSSGFPARCNCGGGFPSPSRATASSARPRRRPTRRASTGRDRGRRSTPMSWSSAATSSRSRSCSAKPICFAHAEQVSATRSPCPAVAACLHCNAAKRLLAMPNRRRASRVSDDSSSGPSACR